MERRPSVPSPPQPPSQTLRRHSSELTSGIASPPQPAARSRSRESNEREAASKNPLDDRWSALRKQASNLTLDRSSKDGASGYTGSNFGSELSSRAGGRPVGTMLSRQLPEDDSDNELTIARAEEWRIFLANTPEARRSFDLAKSRMEELMEKLAIGKPNAGKGFQVEDPYVEQYFCAGPKCRPRVETRRDKSDIEVKMLQGVSERGTELWSRSNRAEVSSFAKLPWVALQKDRSICRAARAFVGTRLEGLVSLESAELKVSERSVYPNARGGMQRLKDTKYLTIGLEGTPDAIGNAILDLRLDDLMPYVIKNPDGSGLYRNNVSYPRFLIVEADNSTTSNLRTEEALRVLERRPSQLGMSADYAQERRSSIEKLEARLMNQNCGRPEEKLEELEELQVLKSVATVRPAKERLRQTSKDRLRQSSKELSAVVEVNSWSEAVAEVLTDSSMWLHSRIPEGDLNVAGPEILAAMLDEMRALRTQNRQLQAEVKVSRANLASGLSKMVGEFQIMLQKSELDQGLVTDSLALNQEALQGLVSCVAGSRIPNPSLGQDAAFQARISRVAAGSRSPSPSSSPLVPPRESRDQRLGRRMEALVGRPKSPSTLRPLAQEVAQSQLNGLLGVHPPVGSSLRPILDRVRGSASPPLPLPPMVSSPWTGVRVRSQSPQRLRSPGFFSPGFPSNGRDDAQDPSAKKPLERSFDHLRATLDRASDHQGGIITRVGARRSSQLTDVQGLRAQLFM